MPRSHPTVVAPRTPRPSRPWPWTPLPPAERIQVLTKRELHIVWLMAWGLDRDEIATALCRSAKTIDHHRSGVMQKLGLNSRLAVVVWAREWVGLLAMARAIGPNTIDGTKLPTGAATQLDDACAAELSGTNVTYLRTAEVAGG